MQGGARGLLAGGRGRRALRRARCVNGRGLVAPTVDAGPAVAAAPAAGSPRLYGAFLAAFYAPLLHARLVVVVARRAADGGRRGRGRIARIG